MTRGVLFTAAALCCAAYAVAQDTELFIYGDDVLTVYVNGQRVITSRYINASLTPDTVSARAQLVRGTNVIAAKVDNIAWGGGLVAYLPLPGGTSVVSGANWKTSLTGPSGWQLPGYSEDNAWVPSYVIGQIPQCALSSRGQSLNVFTTHGAPLIWQPATICFRKEIADVTPGAGSILIRGFNFRYRLHVNGAMIGERTTPYPRESGSTTHACTWAAGPNVIAIEATLVEEPAPYRGSGAHIKLAAFNGPSTVIAYSDNQWKCAFEGPSGWTSAGFDDSRWATSDIVDAYDKTGPAEPIRPYPFMWSGSGYFRTQFECATCTGETGVLRPGQARPQNRLPSGPSEYFSLQGRAAPVAQVKGTVRVLVERSASCATRAVVGPDCARRLD